MNVESVRNEIAITKAKESRDRALNLALRDTNPEGKQSVIFVSVRAPIDHPKVEGLEELFDRCVLELHRAVAPLRAMGTHEDALGLYHLYSVNGAPRPTKEQCVKFEQELPWRALFDIDVYDPSGISVDRAGCGLEARTCPICEGNAKACSRSRAHSIEEQNKRAHELIARGLCK